MGTQASQAITNFPRFGLACLLSHKFYPKKYGKNMAHFRQLFFGLPKLPYLLILPCMECSILLPGRWRWTWCRASGTRWWSWQCWHCWGGTWPAGRPSPNGYSRRKCMMSTAINSDRGGWNGTTWYYVYVYLHPPEYPLDGHVLLPPVVGHLILAPPPPAEHGALGCISIDILI